MDVCPSTSRATPDRHSDVPFSTLLLIDRSPYPMLEKTLQLRLGSAAVIALLLVLVCPETPTTAASDSPVPDPPSEKELRQLQELADWVFGESSKVRSGEERQALVQSIRNRRDTFELFRRYSDEASRRRLLADIPHGDAIHGVARELGVDSLLLVAMVEAESSFDSRAVSRRGAVGLMQVLPETAAQFGEFDLWDPASNVRAGAAYLRHLLARYDGNLEVAVAAYNAGPGNVHRFGGIPPFRETTRYVERVLSRYVEYHRELWREERELRTLLATVGNDV